MPNTTPSTTFQPYFQHHSTNEQQADEERLYRVRERQWMYLGPIVAAPLAHIGVTLYRSAHTPFQKRLVVGGILTSTVLAVGMRMVLMVHAGYPGGPNLDMAQREKWVSLDEKERPLSTMEMAKEIFKGFG